jgi:hypothetical protein
MRPQLYFIDGKPCQRLPDGKNAKGYPYVVEPVKSGTTPTRRRLYEAEHLKRRGIEPRDTMESEPGRLLAPV